MCLPDDAPRGGTSLRHTLGLGATAVAVAVAVALLVGGCGSSGDGDGGHGGDTSSTGSGGDAGKGEGGPDDGGPGGGGADTGGDGGSDAGPGGDGEKADLSPYIGPWAAGLKTDRGSPMILIFHKDATVSLAGQDLACQGTLKAATDPAKLEMECRDGEDRYARGTITELDGDKLTVEWASGKPTEFRKGAAPAGPPGE